MIPRGDKRASINRPSTWSGPILAHAQLRTAGTRESAKVPGTVEPSENTSNYERRHATSEEILRCACVTTMVAPGQPALRHRGRSDDHDGLGLRYQDDCFKIDVTYQRSFIRDQDIERQRFRSSSRWYSEYEAAPAASALWQWVRPLQMTSGLTRLSRGGLGALGGGYFVASCLRRIRSSTGRNDQVLVTDYRFPTTHFATMLSTLITGCQPQLTKRRPRLSPAAQLQE